MTDMQLKYLQHQETSRHNVATETQDVNELVETSRSNLAREAETERSNLAREAETNRSNLAREAETARANRAHEEQAAAELEQTKKRDANKAVTDSVNAGANLAKAFVPLI